MSWLHSGNTNQALVCHHDWDVLAKFSALPHKEKAAIYKAVVLSHSGRGPDATKPVSWLVIDLDGRSYYVEYLLSPSKPILYDLVVMI